MNEKSFEYIVSACLAGEECRYDCKSKPQQRVIDLVNEGKALSVCPEQMGGLPTPRPITEEVQTLVFKNEDGTDVTKEFLKGATEASLLAKSNNVQTALLKSKSSMCGYGKVYDGNFSGNLTEGNGLFSRMLEQLGIKIEEID